MPRPRISRAAIALLALVAAPGAFAQLTSVPDLSSVTLPTATTQESTATDTTGSGQTSNTAATTGTGATTGTASTTGGTSGTDSASASSITGDQSSNPTVTFTGSVTSTFHLTGLPTIAGAGIPPLVVPYTADAPFMQKSNLPEGTVFIAVGATLAFLGACVLLWRGLVAWSINRSVKRAALASLRQPEKSSGWGGSTRTGYYRDDAAGSSMSLDALTSSGKPIKNFRDADNTSRGSSNMPPAGLFFSPTANAQQRNSSVTNFDQPGNRASGYLPSGYYAAASSAPAGGAPTTTIGSSLAPYARQSALHTPSPPVSPAFPESANGSREGLRSGPRERLPSRDRHGQTSSYYRQSNASGSGFLHANTEYVPGQRAPSAYLEDLFDPTQATGSGSGAAR